MPKYRFPAPDGSIRSRTTRHERGWTHGILYEEDGHWILAGMLYRSYEEAKAAARLSATYNVTPHIVVERMNES
jgi:hypothetical protein